MSDPTTPRSRLDNVPIPRAIASPQAARAFVWDVPALIRRINRLAYLSRDANDESREAMARAAAADGVQLAPSRIHRMETQASRSEVDLITTLWVLIRGGYTLADLYPPAAGAGASELTDEERTLLRLYRTANPSVRGAIVGHAAFLAKEGSFGQDTSERPSNVHEMPRPEASAEGLLASEQLAHETHAEITAAQDTIRERKRGKGSRPRRVYGANGTNGKAGG